MKRHCKIQKDTAIQYFGRQELADPKPMWFVFDEAKPDGQ
jgi:hypothetical protein